MFFWAWSAPALGRLLPPGHLLSPGIKHHLDNWCGLHYIAFYSPKNLFFWPKQTLKKVPRMANSYFMCTFYFDL